MSQIRHAAPMTVAERYWRDGGKSFLYHAAMKADLRGFIKDYG
jgi:hypothetical protein